MGTRNITVVFKDGEPRVVQYGQWDGQPDGQGRDILRFLREEGNIEKLKNNLSKVRFLEIEGRDKGFVEEYNKNLPDHTLEQKIWFDNYKSRNIGGKILANIANSVDDEILLVDETEFATDGFMCEWIWAVDLDKNIFGSISSREKLEIDLETDAYFDLQSLPSEDDFLAKYSINDDA